MRVQERSAKHSIRVSRQLLQQCFLQRNVQQNVHAYSIGSVAKLQNHFSVLARPFIGK